MKRVHAQALASFQFPQAHTVAEQLPRQRTTAHLVLGAVRVRASDEL